MAGQHATNGERQDSTIAQKRNDSDHEGRELEPVAEHQDGKKQTAIRVITVQE